MFNKGDKVKLKVSMWSGLSPFNYGFSFDKIYVVSQVVDKTYPAVSFEEVNGLYDIEYFELATVKPKLSIGDKVIAVMNTPDVQEGWTGYITKVTDGLYAYEAANGPSLCGPPILFKEKELELLKGASVIHNINIERPILEERKIGKVKTELFDEGFPNAVLEVAKVMTWAAENKGYKPHDWKNLPNADTEFSAAASRHRLKGWIQKLEGAPALERIDEESNIVHLAHTAFNVLAELELVLTGKIK